MFTTASAVGSAADSSSSKTPEVVIGAALANVHFRMSPNGTINTTVRKGEFFKVLETADGWSKVQLASGQIGYIFNKYISTKSPEVPETEGGFCETCLLNRGKQQPAEQAQNVIDLVNPLGPYQSCLTQKMIAGAKYVVKHRYQNRKRGKGDCGRGVRYALTQAGIWPGGGIGHAKDTLPGLKRMGFVNIKKPGMTPGNAPNGSILVYGKALIRGCRGLGSTYGHIEIKENNNSYLYDANPAFNIQQAYGPQCRPLIGVMVMGSQCLTCSSATKKACGGN